MAAKIPEFQKEVADFRKQYGDKKVGEITVNMVGSTAIKSFVYQLLCFVFGL